MMRQTLIGEVSELYESEISLKTEEGYRRIAVEDILQIQLVEGEWILYRGTVLE